MQQFFQVHKSSELAKIFLNATEAVRAGKNWNSFAANTGVSICTMALLLLDMAKNEGPCADPALDMPQAVSVCGSPRGHADNVYLEYMIASPDMTAESAMLDDGYLHNIFDSENLTPTRSCTCDWVVTWEGCPLLFGEGKSSGQTQGLALQCVLAFKQLANSPTAVTMQSTNTAFNLATHFEVEVHTTMNGVGYVAKELESVYLVSMRYDLRGKANTTFEQADVHANPPHLIHEKSWENLYDTDRTFLTAYFETVDALVTIWKKIDFEDAKQNFTASYALVPTPTCVIDEGVVLPNPERFKFDPNKMYREPGEITSSLDTSLDS